MSLKFNKMQLVDKTKHEKSYLAGVRAYVSITINDTFKVGGFRVLEHKSGLWVSPPSNNYETANGKKIYDPLFSFVKDEHNAMLFQDIIKKYKEVLNGAEVAEKSEVEAAY